MLNHAHAHIHIYSVYYVGFQQLSLKIYWQHKETQPLVLINVGSPS